MTRHVLIRGEDGESVVREAELLAEKNLHDVLTRYPQLVPSDDLELDRSVVAGRESGLASGYADLVLIDSSAQICLVEVKKEGNPDTRRVIAQLLDYAAALWQMSAADFERIVLHPHLRATGVADVDLPDIVGFAVSSFADPDAMSSEDSDGDFADFGYRLEQTLAGGDFRLVVAAPSIPPGVQQVIEYLNSRGHLIYGLEVSFFNGPAECFVPRIVVKPSVTETKKAGVGPTPIAQEDFLQNLPDRVRDRARGFLQASAESGARIRWHSYGPGVRADRQPERLLAFLESKRLGIVVTAPAGYPELPFVDARAASQALGVGAVSTDEWTFAVRYEDASDEQLESLLNIALQLVHTLATNVEFTALDPPVEASFERNDHNIWAKHVPAIAAHVGEWLRGELKSLSAAAPVRLEPLAKGQPGWKPRFSSDEALNAVWPTGVLEGHYELRIDGVGSPLSLS